MYPFWDLAIWPIIEASRARRIVEIGALRGETTALMLDRLGPDSELHVIDPVPEFDPAEHERQFPGRYNFYRDISHNVLPELPAVDVALVDGDHNWYTVYHELRMLAESARRDGQPLPVLILHDVCWPYGRRDLYYAPERIPEEFRKEYAQQGMRPGTRQLLPGGGLNPTMFNAVMEGGERNGVMTALDDFIAEHDRPVRRLLIPIYFGLEIVVEQARLDATPELADALDRLETRDGKDHLLELAETVRLQAMIFQHNVYHHRERLLTSAASRYLGLLKAALLNEIYLDHEARLHHLSDSALHGRQPSPQMMRDPVRSMPRDMERLAAERRAGPHAMPMPSGSRLPYAEMGRVRLEHIQSCLDTVRVEAVEGDLVECGTGRGGGAAFMRGYLDAHEMHKRSVWIADRFRVEERDDPLDVWTDLNSVREGLDRLGLLDERVRFLQGPPGESISSSPVERIALLRIGSSTPADAAGALDACYDRISTGGFVVVDGYNLPDVRSAINEVRSRRRITSLAERIDWWGAAWRKDAPALPTALGTAELEGHPPLATPAPAASKDLSVVVVFYNMKREAARTLHSLSHAYQQGVDDLDYEVIVVENGSAREERLGEEMVRGFGEEFRYIDLGAEATLTPVDALNCGLAAATGRSIAFMIDGAHLLTPGVLRYGMTGLSAYAPSIVVTQQWYLGPGQQPDVMLSGYDRAYEDRVLEQIEWPVDGYRLFEAGHFIGDRDWLDGLWESNCIFVPRSLLEQAGGFDESFATPGGGYANLDFYERFGATPGVNVVTILGEGSFHQIHGGTTTNAPDVERRRETITGYADQYRDLRGRSFIGPGKNLHFVGTMVQSAKRTRARRVTTDVFAKVRSSVIGAGFPTKPTPVPEELQDAFLEAFWYGLACRDTSWLGTRVGKSPGDLLSYQEMIERVRPDWVIETGAGNGGLALYLASVCELLGQGHVIGIDTKLHPERAQHPRITYIEGPAHSENTVTRVSAEVGKETALVILGSQPGSLLRILTEFKAYEHLVSPGSYVIVENTILNGHPVWPGFGPGPSEAVKRILATNSDFAADSALERYGPSFNHGGFLKRIR